MTDFVRFCNRCYTLFRDPVLYQQHVEACGKVQGAAPEPVSPSADAPDSTTGTEADGTAVPDGGETDAPVPDGTNNNTETEGTGETVQTPPSQPRTRKPK